MNIYEYYNKPQELKWHDEIYQHVPEVFWNSVYADYTPEQIEAMSKTPKYAYFYTMNTIRDRWPEAETYLMKSPVWAFFYAKNVMKNRWPEAEPSIKQNDLCWDEYKKHFGIQ